MNDWVRVEDRLPDGDDLVFVYCKSGATFKGHYTNNQWSPDFPTELLESYDNWNNLHFGEMSDCIIPDATHWQYITPPTEEIEDE